MLTPIEIFRTFAPYIGTIKQNNIIYQDKKIYLQDTGTLIFDMDLGETENIYFPTSIFNTILKTKNPSFKRQDDQLYVESTTTNGKKKHTNFTYYKLDKNPISIIDKENYEIIYKFEQEDILSIAQYTKYLQKESDATYSGIFISNNKKYFASGSKTFSYIQEINNNFPTLNLIHNFIFQSLEEGEVNLCKNNHNHKYFYLITGEGFICTLPVFQEKIYPKNILEKYETICNKDFFYNITFSFKDIKDALKDIMQDIGKNDLLYLELEVSKTELSIKMQNKEKVSSKIKINCTSEQELIIKINNPEEKEILNAFLKYDNTINLLIPKHSSLGKICIIDNDIKFICTYNELKIL